MDSPEQRLWRAVLFTALHDAVGVITGVSENKTKKDNGKSICVVAAILWFERGREVPLVCDLAGLEHTAVRAAAQQAVGYRWGPEPAEAARRTNSLEMTRKSLASMKAKLGHAPSVVEAILQRTRDDE